MEADLQMPLYDGDLEEAEGGPESAERIAAQIAEADAVILSTPEYNKGPSGVLKNALDWLSRSKPGPLEGKPVAIVSAAAGRAGGERAQFSLRHCLTPFNPRILQGPEFMLAGAHNAFDDTGRIKDEKTREFLGVLMGKLKEEIARG